MIRVLILAYLLIVLTITLDLFMYNRFGASSIGSRTIFASDNSKCFKKGALVIAKKDVDTIEIGDNILFYNVYTTKSDVLCQNVISKDQTNDKEITYKLDNNKYVSSSYVIGTKGSSKTISKLGHVFGVLTSSAGYFLFCFTPTLILFIYQVRNIFQKQN